MFKSKLQMQFTKLFKFARAYLENWTKAEVGDKAAILAYTTVLSLVPFMAVFLSLSKKFGQLYIWAERIKELILKYATLGTVNSFGKGLDEAIGRLDIETTGYIGFFATIITSLFMLNTINTAVQKTWNVSKFRSIGKRITLYVCFVLFGPLVITILLAIVTSFYSMESSELPPSILTACYLTFLLFLLNRFLPNRDVTKWPALIAAVVTAISMVVLQIIFLWAVKNILSYNEVYGSLASLPMFLFWLFLVWFTILSGVVLCATLQKRYEIPGSVST